MDMSIFIFQAAHPYSKRSQIYPYFPGLNPLNNLDVWVSSHQIQVLPNNYHAANVSRRQVPILKNVKKMEFHDYIWNRHAMENTFNMSTNMHRIGSEICEINFENYGI